MRCTRAERLTGIVCGGWRRTVERFVVLTFRALMCAGTRKVMMADTAPKPTHAEWQATVEDVAKLHHWSFLHVRKSIAKGGRWATTTNVVGWPDLFLWHPIRGFAAIECKVLPDKPTKEQTAVLEELAGAGARTMVAYFGEIDAVSKFLRGVNSLG